MTPNTTTMSSPGISEKSGVIPVYNQGPLLPRHEKRCNSTGWQQVLGCLTLVLFLATSGFSQRQSSISLDGPAPKRAFQYGVDAGILGTSIFGEYAASMPFAIRLDVSYVGTITGIQNIISHGGFNRTFLELRANAGLEPRWYYNNRRFYEESTHQQGFFALRLQYNSPLLYSTVEASSPSVFELGYDWNPSVFQHADLVPMWGFRIGRGLVRFETSTGYAIPLKGLLRQEYFPDETGVRIRSRVMLIH